MKTHVAMILDSSGSMEPTKQETIGGFNEQLATLRSLQTESHQINVTFTIFGTKSDTVYVDRPISEVADLTEETYKPSGWTSLYDAVGTTIVRLEDEVISAKDDAFLIMIVSDGQENMSKEYTSKSLSAVINRLKATDHWTFTYLGSNQDLAQVQETLGVDAGNLCSYSSDAGGTTKGFAAQNSGTSSYFSARSAGMTSSSNLYSDNGEIADAESLPIK